MTSETTEKNTLASAPIRGLMLKYAIPSVIALVVNALYNIVDQVFIGWGVGTLGNSATNVIFPLNMVMMALALLIGDGGAAYLSLELGRGNKEKASKGTNNTFSWLINCAWESAANKKTLKSNSFGCGLSAFRIVK